MSDGTDEITLTVTKAGQLSLTCQPPAFERLRDLIVAEAGPQSLAAVGLGELQLVVIQKADPAQASLPTRRQDVRMLLGCGIVSFVVLIPFLVGIGTILGWLK